MSQDCEKTIVVMCNGRSLKDVDFSLLEGIDTFGMNMAFRYYNENNWYPTYFASFDYNTNDRNAKSFVDLMSGNNTIERFFFIRDFSKFGKFSRFTHVKLHDKEVGWNKDEQAFGHFHSFWNTGTNVCSTAVCMGYNNIILLGADNTQKEFYNGVVSAGGNQRVMESTPDHNPCYWMDDYFREGDVFNAPNKDIYHTPWWPKFAKMARKNGVRVVNCSEISLLDCFEKSTLLKELERLKR